MSEFGHLGGASTYGSSYSDLDDDSSSLHSSAISQAPDPSSRHHHYGENDLEDLDNFNKLELNDHSISGGDHDHYHDHAQSNGGGGGANLYEEDFDGMLDDMNRVMPPHACR